MVSLYLADRTPLMISWKRIRYFTEYFTTKKIWEKWLQRQQVQKQKLDWNKIAFLPPAEFRFGRGYNFFTRKRSYGLWKTTGKH